MKRKNMPIAAAIFYFIGGFQLLLFSFLWLHLLTEKQIIIGLVLGLFIGVGKYFGLFHRLNKKNIERLKNNGERQKLLTVFKAKTYLIIILMVALGISLRVILDVDRKYLLPVYFAIGLALMMSSIFYLVYFFKWRKAIE